MNANIYEIQIMIDRFILWFMGETDDLLRVMITLAIIEYVTGIMCLCKKKTITWGTTVIGVRQKILMLTMIGIANLFDTYVCGQAGVLRELVVVFYISVEGCNVLKNTKQLGIPLPKALEDALSKPSKKSSVTDESELES